MDWDYSSRKGRYKQKKKKDRANEKKIKGKRIKE